MTATQIGLNLFLSALCSLAVLLGVHRYAPQWLAPSEAPTAPPLRIVVLDHDTLFNAAAAANNKEKAFKDAFAEYNALAERYRTAGYLVFDSSVPRAVPQDLLVHDASLLNRTLDNPAPATP